VSVNRVACRVLLAAAVPAGALLWAAFAPMAAADRDEVFAIPKGTWARRMSGDKVEILPNEVRLTLGIKDVLVLKNEDEVPQVFGPVLMMPGQTFRLPFETASSYQFACTAHASGQMTVTVAPGPEAGWERLAWRTRSLMSSRGQA
jgi:plastocyanin